MVKLFWKNPTYVITIHQCHGRTQRHDMRSQDRDLH